MRKTIWKIKESEKSIINRVAKDNNLSKTAATILVNRGLIDQKDIHRFLEPDKSKFHDPYLLKGMDKAVDRIIKALNNNEKIMIYGDYDVDGITSTSILYMFLQEIGCHVDYYIPDRFEEGYGVNSNAVNMIKQSGTDLMITVDTGITTISEAELAKSLGLDLIITDHHECQGNIPEAIAVINPKRPDCEYPFKMLAGVGVTFKLIHALAIKKYIEDNIWKYLDIVAVGTIADIVPLQDENRIIVKIAFVSMIDTWNIGLKALLKVSGVEGNKMSAGTIGYRIGPRLNASGRLGDAKKGVELFTTHDEKLAMRIAEELDEKNKNRQDIEQKILDEAIIKIETTIDLKKTKIIVVAGEEWNHGVIGIVASRITERYYRPSIVLTVEGDKASGSARSVSGFSIFQALRSCDDVFEKFGGHDMAAGMSLSKDRINELRSRLNQYAFDVMDEKTLIPKIKLDQKLPIEQISIPLIEEIKLFEPYGIGNEEPKFLCPGRLSNMRQIGKNNNHLKLEINHYSTSIDGIGFNLASYFDYFYLNSEILIACTLDINEWNNVQKPQLMIKDIKYSNLFEAELDEAIESTNNLNNHYIEEIKALKLVPNRDDFAKLYRYIAHMDKIHMKQIPIVKLMEDFNIEEPKKMVGLLFALKVFMELGLLVYAIEDYRIEFTIIKGKKVELSQSKLYNKLH